jgi:L-seryl-tRNA(Ser) seleniumtransferase
MKLAKALDGVTRRQWLRLASLFGAGTILPSLPSGPASAEANGWSNAVRNTEVSAAQTPSAAGPGAARTGSFYESLGVRPLINCRGTLTVIGGSMELPEVRAAKDRANQQYVQIDELMDAAGKRLAELTGAEWGMVSAGCAAAMSHATAACVAGGNPDLHVRIPDLTGFAKDEVIIPTHSRNVYDAAIRAVGVKIIEVETPDDLKLAIGPKTAMIYFFAGARNETGPMSLEAIAAIAKPHNVPIMVDAAAEVLTVPSIHLQRGATLVGYSGGKIIRGPQSAGVLLGRKDLVKAAWVHSAPHHGYARAMKVGREEVVGMVVAIEQWVKRDHDAEWKKWTARMEHVATRVTKIPGVSARVGSDLGGRSNRSPRLSIRWDSKTLGITGSDVAAELYGGEPRIALNGGGGGGGGARGGGQAELPGDTGVSLNASTMADGDEKIVADRLFQVLSAKHTLKPVEAPKTPTLDLTGQWLIDIVYAAGKTTHTLHLRQQENGVTGTHQGDFLARDISGTISADAITLGSNVTERHGDALTYRFSGKATGSGDAATLSGTLDMGEYLTATWTGRRYQAGNGRTA